MLPICRVNAPRLFVFPKTLCAIRQNHTDETSINYKLPRDYHDDTFKLHVYILTNETQ